MRKAQCVCRMIFESRKKICVKDDAILNDLAESRTNLALGQSGKRREIGENGGGLVESADEILAEAMVDGDLAADA